MSANLRWSPVNQASRQDVSRSSASIQYYHWDPELHVAFDAEKIIQFALEEKGDQRHNIFRSTVSCRAKM